MQIPKNVIQTGESDPCHKIYMEDYVHTLLTQYRENEADFCLYGKREQEGEISYYFIYGAAKEEPGWELMESRYFALQRRIGEVTFDAKEAWAFFEDGYSAPLDGYFIFYEQNEDMQSYLIAMHQNQPGEKTVEVRRRDRTAGKTESAPNGPQEPRRIRRSPMVYDLKKDGQSEEKREKEESGRVRQRQEEKVLHAAQAVRGHGALRNREESGRRTSFRIKAAALAVLLGLCAAAVTSVNGYQDAEQAGNFFSQALDELRGGNGNGGNASGGSGSGTLIVEETQFASAENDAEAALTETLPVLSADVARQEETSVDSGETADSETGVNAGAATEPSTGTDLSAEAASSTAAVMTPETDPLPSAENADAAAAEMTGENTASGGGAAPSEQAASDEQAVASEQTASTGTVSYIVQRGDNLAAICRRQYGNTDRVEEIAELNRLTDPNHLIPGQKIILPQE